MCIAEAAEAAEAAAAAAATADGDDAAAAKAAIKTARLAAIDKQADAAADLDARWQQGLLRLVAGEGAGRWAEQLAILASVAQLHKNHEECIYLFGLIEEDADGREASAMAAAAAAAAAAGHGGAEAAAEAELQVGIPTPSSRLTYYLGEFSPVTAGTCRWQRTRRNYSTPTARLCYSAAITSAQPPSSTRRSAYAEMLSRARPK